MFQMIWILTAKIIKRLSSQRVWMTWKHKQNLKQSLMKTKEKL